MEGGDLKTLPRQHGGIFGLLGKLFGLGPGELQKQMSDPIKQQMLMQRGGFPWALAGLSLLPTLLARSLPRAILTFHHPGGQHFWKRYFRFCRNLYLRDGSFIVRRIRSAVPRDQK